MALKSAFDRSTLLVKGFAYIPFRVTIRYVPVPRLASGVPESTAVKKTSNHTTGLIVPVAFNKIPTPVYLKTSENILRPGYN